MIDLLDEQALPLHLTEQERDAEAREARPEEVYVAGDRPRQLDWTNILVILAAHVVAALAIPYMVFVQFSWWTVGLAFLWFACSGLAITGGYHRLFAHPTYKANRALRLFYLFFGAGSVQNSALKWSADHRVHHAHTDTDKDPYNIERGFWWAHIAWVFYKDADSDLGNVRDLKRDELITWQHENYVALALIAGLVVPALLGLLWGDPLGALLVAGVLRLVVQWHATFSVNSFAHWWGSRPHSTKTSARDSFWVALITLGEGYHNFHHRFPMDYRNGFRWFHFDPTKWIVWTLSKVGVTRNLRRARSGPWTGRGRSKTRKAA